MIYLTVFATGVCTLMLLRSLNQPRELKHESVVRVRRVLDGKTAIVARGANCYTIRLEAIDGPEGYESGGEQACQALEELIGDRPVLVEISSKGGYDRIIATLYVKSHRGNEWINVNNRMVELGQARIHREFYKHLPLHRRQELNRLERHAQSRRIGLWQNAPEPLPPASEEAA